MCYLYEVPHLHAHIFLRYLSDADFGRRPEETAFTELEPQAYRHLLESLRENLALNDG